jgi:hypothetical protein
MLIAQGGCLFPGLLKISRVAVTRKCSTDLRAAASRSTDAARLGKLKIHALKFRSIKYSSTGIFRIDSGIKKYWDQIKKWEYSA